MPQFVLILSTMFQCIATMLSCAMGQGCYYPPLDSNDWEKVSPKRDTASSSDDQIWARFMKAM